MAGDPHPPVPTAALFGLLVTFTSWQLVLLSLLVEGHMWAKLLFAAVSLMLTIFLATVGRRAAAPYWRQGGRIALTPGQSVLVVLYILLFGILCGLAMVLKFG